MKDDEKRQKRGTANRAVAEDYRARALSFYRLAGRPEMEETRETLIEIGRKLERAAQRRERPN
jgi:dienelactone hydrolase